MDGTNTLARITDQPALDRLAKPLSQAVPGRRSDDACGRCRDHCRAGRFGDCSSD